MAYGCRTGPPSYIHVSNKTLHRIPPPWPDGARSNGQGRQTFCPSPLLVFYIPPCWKTFPEVSGDLPCEKKKECKQGRLKLTPLEGLAWVHKILNIKPYSDISSTLHSSMLGDIPTQKNVKYQHGRGTKCSSTNRGLFNSQNCNFSEESFILISFCHSVDWRASTTTLCHSQLYVPEAQFMVV